MFISFLVSFVHGAVAQTHAGSASTLPRAGTSAHTIVFLVSKSFFTLLFIIFLPIKIFQLYVAKIIFGGWNDGCVARVLIKHEDLSLDPPCPQKKMPGIVCAGKSNGTEAEANGSPRHVEQAVFLNWQALGLVRYPLARLQWRACVTRLKVTTSCLMTWVQSPGVIGLKEELATSRCSLTSKCTLHM